VKVPLNWLRDYGDWPVTPEELANRLTFAGLEVAAVRRTGIAARGVVVAEIRTVEPHPQAEGLMVCRVYDGRDELPIVCGAPNCAAGQKVPLAPIGAVLAGGTRVGEARIRGVRSRGMLCAEAELGLSEDHSGVMILPRDSVPGTAFEELVGPPETVFEIEVTPNRPDCLSLIGVAREVAALCGGGMRRPPAELDEAEPPVDRRATVSVEDPAGCPRYTARVLTGVRVGPSPAWMQRRLSAAGVRPISNVVDVTNYVMLECGQPLHAFDLARLRGEGRIVVRRARPGECIQTLDGRRRPLDPDLLVIADAEVPVAVAGVMGGAGSEIGPDTAAVLLESACFRPADVRRAARRLGLATESSYRFERGVDVEAVEWASRRAAALLAAHAGATVARGVVDVRVPPRDRAPVRLRYERARALLGMELSAETITGALRRLDLPAASAGADACAVDVPSFRLDLETEADLIEEVARIQGLEHVPSPAPAARLVPGADDASVRAVLVCRSNLVGLGLTEILNYSFLSDRLLDPIGHGDPARRVRLPNPITADHAVLRDSLIPQMIETLGRNRSRQAREAALFEIGRVFFRDAAGTPSEEERVCVGLMGPVGRSGMTHARPADAPETYLWAKGIVEAFVQAQRGTTARAPEHLRFSPALLPFGERGLSAVVTLGDERCGVIAAVNSAVRGAWRLADPVAVAELRLAPLLEHVFRVPTARPLTPYPGVDRDVALVVEESVSHADVLAAIARAAPPELADVRLFDIYTGEGIGSGRRSMAYSLTYRSGERTLTDDDANRLHDAIKAALRKALRAEIRER
jgi:phenylalanyl-tRNA synthetase beta chain